MNYMSRFFFNVNCELFLIHKTRTCNISTRCSPVEGPYNVQNTGTPHAHLARLMLG